MWGDKYEWKNLSMGWPIEEKEIQGWSLREFGLIGWLQLCTHSHKPPNARRLWVCPPFCVAPLNNFFGIVVISFYENTLAFINLLCWFIILILWLTMLYEEIVIFFWVWSLTLQCNYRLAKKRLLDHGKDTTTFILQNNLNFLVYNQITISNFETFNVFSRSQGKNNN